MFSDSYNLQMDSERKRREELEREVFHLRGEYNVPTTCYEVKARPMFQLEYSNLISWLFAKALWKLTKMLNQEKHDGARSFRSKVVLIQVDSIQLKSFRSINKVDLIHVNLRMDRIDLLMDRNYFSLYRIDLYQNDFGWKRPNSIKKTGNLQPPLPRPGIGF